MSQPWLAGGGTAFVTSEQPTGALGCVRPLLASSSQAGRGSAGILAQNAFMFFSHVWSDGFFSSVNYYSRQHPPCKAQIKQLQVQRDLKHTPAERSWQFPSRSVHSLGWEPNCLELVMAFTSVPPQHSKFQPGFASALTEKGKRHQNSRNVAQSLPVQQTDLNCTEGIL